MDESCEGTAKGEAHMKNRDFEALLLAAKPKNYSGDSQFTESVMQKVHGSEILSSAVRKTNVNKKETFMTKIKRLPAFALIAIVLSMALFLSGSAYAAYQLLWPKPEVQVSAPEKSISGRDEVALSIEQCGDSTLATHYELKKNATITSSQIAGVVQARCELDTIGTWAQNTFPHDERFAQQNKAAHDSTMLNTSMATHIKSKDDSSITFTGLTKYNQADKTLAATASTRYIADGRDVKADQITENDPVVFITTEVYRVGDSTHCGQSCSIRSEYVSSTLQAVVKLSLPFENYDQFAWQSLTEKQVCQGNPNDTCLTGFVGGIDLYLGTAQMKPNESMMKEIQGVITDINGKSVTIRSSSGNLFTLTTPTDVVTSYNTNKAAQYYNNQTVKVGSRLIVSYIEKENEHSKNLTSSSLSSIQFQIEIVGKSDAPSAY